MTAIKPDNINNINVFMIHGYAQNNTPPGDIYGAYTIETKDGKEYVDMAEPIRNYVNYILFNLFNKEYKFDANSSTNGGFFYEDKDVILTEYAGEWSRHLYGEKGEIGILSFDIELPQNYNKGVIGAGGTDGRNRKYNPNNVGSLSLPFFKNDGGK
jgi:hypothetical protein